jgi:hypothetical protein
MRRGWEWMAPKAQRGIAGGVKAASAEDGSLGASENNSLTRRKFGTALFKEEARLSKHDFISVPEGDAFAWALRD